MSDPDSMPDVDMDAGALDAPFPTTTAPPHLGSSPAPAGPGSAPTAADTVSALDNSVPAAPVAVVREDGASAPAENAALDPSQDVFSPPMFFRFSAYYGSKEHAVTMHEHQHIADLKAVLETLTHVPRGRQKLLGMVRGQLPPDSVRLGAIPFQRIKLVPDRSSQGAEGGPVRSLAHVTLTLLGAPAWTPFPGDPGDSLDAWNGAENELHARARAAFDNAIESAKSFVRQSRVKDDMSKEIHEQFERVYAHTQGFSILHPPRPGKGLLVLDLDYTLVDTKALLGGATTSSIRPHLREFLAHTYPYYDICIWSQTHWRWVEAKMTELHLLSDPRFEISFVLDQDAMPYIRLAGPWPPTPGLPLALREAVSGRMLLRWSPEELPLGSQDKESGIPEIKDRCTRFMAEWRGELPVDQNMWTENDQQKHLLHLAVCEFIFQVIEHQAEDLAITEATHQCDRSDSQATIRGARVRMEYELKTLLALAYELFLEQNPDKISNTAHDPFGNCMSFVSQAMEMYFPLLQALVNYINKSLSPHCLGHMPAATDPCPRREALKTWSLYLLRHPEAMCQRPRLHQTGLQPSAPADGDANFGGLKKEKVTTIHDDSASQTDIVDQSPSQLPVNDLPTASASDHSLKHPTDAAEQTNGQKPLDPKLCLENLDKLAAAFEQALRDGRAFHNVAPESMPVHDHTLEPMQVDSKSSFEQEDTTTPVESAQASEASATISALSTVQDQHAIDSQPQANPSAGGTGATQPDTYSVPLMPRPAKQGDIPTAHEDEVGCGDSIFVTNTPLNPSTPPTHTEQPIITHTTSSTQTEASSRSESHSLSRTSSQSHAQDDTPMDPAILSLAGLLDPAKVEIITQSLGILKGHPLPRIVIRPSHSTSLEHQHTPRKRAKSSPIDLDGENVDGSLDADTIASAQALASTSSHSDTDLTLHTKHKSKSSSKSKSKSKSTSTSKHSSSGRKDRKEAEIAVLGHKRKKMMVKPLELIWRRFGREQYSERNTLQVDDLSRNFALNVANGVQVRGYQDSPHFDTELVALERYCLQLAHHSVPDVSKVDHKHWRSYRGPKADE